VGEELVVPLRAVLIGAALLLSAGVVIGSTFEQRRRGRRARRLADLEREFTRATYCNSAHGAGRAAAASHYQERGMAADGAPVPPGQGRAASATPGHSRTPVFRAEWHSPPPSRGTRRRERRSAR
jgi:hypothetical protein